MAHFHKHPGGQRISGQHVKVDGDTLTVGLWGYLDDQNQELFLSNEGRDLSLDKGGTSGNSRLWKIRVHADARATRESVTDRIYAYPVQSAALEPWDEFEVTFRFKKQPAVELVVRPVTAEVLGGDSSPWRSFKTFDSHVIDRATYNPANVAELLNFRPAPGKPVQLAVYAAKLGAVERAFLLMVPPGGQARNLLIVLSHSFGQNDAHYSGLGYSNPLSPKLIEFVRDQFILNRWGAQLMAARSDYALLMPVRAKAGAKVGELGPFVEQAGVGAKVVQKLLGMTDGAFGLDRVALVTFSNGIAAANQFIAVGGKGLPIHWGVNQDPNGGTPLSAAFPGKKQYLSGFTTQGQPKPGFEFLPMPRWKNEPNNGKLFPKDAFNYMHTWCIPHYTLYLAMV